MRVVIQRTKNAKVDVDQKTVGQSNWGATLLVCLEKNDDQITIAKAAQKILTARIFEDEHQKMNLNIQQVNGSILAISQFTLSWRGDKGNRPSFDLSMEPNQANLLFEEFCQHLGKVVPVETGKFGASMEVTLTNVGPVTFVFEF